MVKRKNNKTAAPRQITIEHALDIALQHHSSGDLSRAEDIYRKILDVEANHPIALHLLGVAAFQCGRNDTAEELIAKALNIEPGFTEAHSNMGLVLQASGRFKDALASHRKAQSLNPDSPEIHTNLGNAFQDLGRLDEALDHFQKALSLHPDSPEILNNLGLAYWELKRHDDAIDSFRRALSIMPGFDDARVNLANVLMDQERTEEALACYRETLENNPNHAKAHYNLGNALRELEQMQEATVSYRRALKILPDFAKAHNNLGLTLQEMGMLEEAETCFKKALDIKPDYAQAHRHLAHIKKFRVYDADIGAMEETLAQPDISEEQKMHLFFALGKAFEDLQEYEQAFDFFMQGNVIKRGEKNRLIEKKKNLFDSLTGLFDQSLFDTLRGSGCKDETPIFILGMPRSGSTLIEQILASHPQVSGVGEKPILYRTIENLFGDVTFPEFAHTLQHADSGAFEQAGETYIKSLRASAMQVQFVTNKMLDNFLYIGMIKLMLPNAKVIHCRRNPEDNCMSIFKCYFSNDGYEYSNDLEELAEYFNLYRELMNHWHRMLPNFIHDIDYEDMVNDQEGKTRELLNYCGMQWDDVCLEFYKTDRTVKTASLEQVRKPVYKSSIQSWKRYENQLTPMLEILQRIS